MYGVKRRPVFDGAPRTPRPPPVRKAPRGLLYPYLLLPVGAFCSALSLGKRQGFCPLYPVACAGFLFCFALLARLVSNVADTDMLPIAFLAALAGGLTGAALRRRRGGAGE